jgi:DNA mismatch repair ATPase MutS
MLVAWGLDRVRGRLGVLLPRWLDVWYELEALSALATYAYLHPAAAFPSMDADAVAAFDGQALGHPLIREDVKVRNDFALSGVGKLVIITGSNMSGKSSFLRTVGLALCMAYAGGVVDAKALHVSAFRLFTCIRVSDSVVEGFSYFYAEVRRLRGLLDALDAESSVPVFYLIDEIFKGTNNRERLIGSRSYLRALVGRRGLGLVSTHDLELVQLADELPGVSNMHFREGVVDERMVFDYTLRDGASPTTNALTIMRLAGLPIEADGSPRTER